MIYGVGLPRTGTTSLIEALKILGFKENEFKVGDYVYWVDKSDGAKFILTYRDPEEWYRSVCRWSLRRDKLTPKMLMQRYRMYGRFLPHFSKKHFIRRFIKHHRLMKRRYKNLLVVDWSRHGWEELCEYLDRPIPDVPFPHLNRYDRNSKS